MTPKNTPLKEKKIHIKKQIKPEILSPDKKNKTDDEPSWYHYLIVLVVFAVLIGATYYAFEYFDTAPEATGTAKKFNYKYVVANTTYNIEFNHPIDQIQNSNILIIPTKFDILNTIEFIFALDKYNGTDNGYVSVSAVKLANFFRIVYKFSYTADNNFKTLLEFNCDNATKTHKVITFEPRANENAIYLKNGNCLELKAKTPKELILVSDALIYSLIKED